MVIDQKDIEIKELKERLLLSEKRYEVAMGFSNVTVFDYNVITKKIVTQHEDFEIFGMPAVMENGLEDIISSGIIASRSHEDFRNLYDKIDSGEPSAKITIYVYDVDGHERVVEILLVNIFNSKNEPVYAIGVRKDVTDLQLLKNETAYKKAIAENTILTYEANVTIDRFTSYNKEWFEAQGIEKVGSVNQSLRYICDNLIDPDMSEKIYNNTSNEAIIDAYNEGQRLLSFQYLKLVQEGIYEWFEKTIHIIKDDLTGDINVRCYVKNINEVKEKEKRALEEQCYYESMVSNSDAAYVFNFTKNLILSGHENWNKLFGISITNNYTEMIEVLWQRAIHPHDREKFRIVFTREYILNEYAQGNHEIVHEYRRPNIYGEFIWVCCTIYLYADATNGDIKAYAYVKSIDVQKREQLKLIYKSQRDTLTGCYNKGTLEEEITDFLKTSDAKLGVHAFFILDLDYFKAINDNFGHAFGDAFLSKTAYKIRALFREDDIVGRIGGDEFVVFMKNIQNIGIARIKAAEICKAVSETYTQNKKTYHVSLSIGIALYKEHGKSYHELYHNSDTALYYAKEHGRNQFAIFNDTMHFGSTNIKEIDSGRMLQASTFEDNIGEYVSRILYESLDKEVAINAVLGLIGKHYNASRVYIFENSEDGLSTSNTFEWCDDGIAPQIDSLQEIWYSPIGNYSKHFNEEGYFYMPDVEQADPLLKAVIYPQDVKSMLQFSIMKQNKLVAFIGFDECKRLRTPTEIEFSECRNMTNVIGIFIMEMRAIEKAKAEKRLSNASEQMALSIVNGLGSYTYVCDFDTYRILFMNSCLTEAIPEAKIGDICYQAFWAREAACENCPMKELMGNEISMLTKELYNANLKLWVKITTSRIDWKNGEKACLVESVDITKYMK